MQARAHHAGVTRLAADLTEIRKRAPKDMRSTVHQGVRVGNDLAKGFARRSSGKTARLYPGTFSTKMNRTLGAFGATVHSGEYGPFPRGQGLLAPILDRGSRNNPAHHDLAKSADIIGPAFQGEVHRLPDRWFW